MMVVRLQLVEFLWLILAIGFLIAFCIHKSPVKLPSLVQQVFQDLIRYGKTKTRIQRPAVLRLLDLPKRWFWHFYAVSMVWNGLLLFLSFRALLFGSVFPEFLTHTLRVLTGQPRTAWGEPPLSVILLLGFLWLHSIRRLLECLFVSVFSDARIHAVQYVFGLSYYVLLGLTVLCVDDSQHVKGQSELSSDALLSQVTWHHLVGGVLFVSASLLQHRSLLLLAKLRTNSSGKVKTLAHKMPAGGWFELVSCPHYLAELLIYAALGVCCCSVTWWIVVFYVFCNQALAAQLCHEYYTSTFKTYPHQRRAFIPYLL